MFATRTQLRSLRAIKVTDSSHLYFLLFRINSILKYTHVQDCGTRWNVTFTGICYDYENLYFCSPCAENVAVSCKLS